MVTGRLDLDEVRDHHLLPVHVEGEGVQGGGGVAGDGDEGGHDVRGWVAGGGAPSPLGIEMITEAGRDYQPRLGFLSGPQGPQGLLGRVPEEVPLDPVSGPDEDLLQVPGQGHPVDLREVRRRDDAAGVDRQVGRGEVEGRGAAVLDEEVEGAGESSGGHGSRG